jgi:hypothetical protein
MARPAFIYAFDILGPYRFTELCGHLFGSRYKGFLLGGVGKDGGIDGELDKGLGEWHPEITSPLLDDLVQPGQLAIFQFKHIMTARVGQARARTQLLSLYTCKGRKKCELHKSLVIDKRPMMYNLVTNVEVNALFRTQFIERCKQEQPNIEHYQVIGLDELESWIGMEPELGHLYLPTIFGPPRFNLRISLERCAHIHPPGYAGKRLKDTLSAMVMNIGTVASYVNSIEFRAIVEGKETTIHLPDWWDEELEQINPKQGLSEPGRAQTYHFRFSDLKQFMRNENDFVFEVLVGDEIENVYRSPMPDHLRQMILEA